MVLDEQDPDRFLVGWSRALAGRAGPPGLARGASGRASSAASLSTGRNGPPVGPAILGSVKVALLGLGLIGGSIALRAPAQPGRLDDRGLEPDRRRTGGRPRGGAHRRGGRLAGRGRSTGARPDRASPRRRSAASSLLDAPRRAARASDARARGGRDRRRRARRARSSRAPRRLGLRFVGGHPMAGREVGGFDAARGRAVQRPAVGRRPAARPRDAAIASAIEALADGLRRRSGARCRPATTTRAVAAISHLPLVVAAALVEAGGRRRGRAADPTGRRPRASPRRAGRA